MSDEQQKRSDMKKCCKAVIPEPCKEEAIWAIYPMEAPGYMWTESCAAHLHQMLSGSEKGFCVYPIGNIVLGCLFVQSTPRAGVRP